MSRFKSRVVRVVCAAVLCASVLPTGAGGAVTQEWPDWTYQGTLPAANANPLPAVDAVVRDNATGDYFALIKASGKVLRVNSDGSVETSWTTYGGSIQLEDAQDIDFDGTYVYVIANGGLYRFNTDGTGAGQRLLSDLYTPTGMAIKGSNLLVTDSYYDRVAVIALSTAFDGALQDVTTTFMGAGSLSDPTDVAVDVDSDYTYVVDGGSNRLARFTGIFGGATPTYYTGLSSASGIACDSSWVYVVNAGEIKKFSQATPTFSEPWLTSGNTLGYVSNPGRIWWDNAIAYMVIADTGNSRIQIYSPSNGYCGAIGGGAGNATGEFYKPGRMAKDSAGNVYVVDSGNDRIQVFGPDGTPGDVIGGSGTQLGQLSAPEGVAVDSAGIVYVADTGNHRVQKFGPGSAVTTLCASGTDEGEVMTPTAIACAPDGSVWVGDRGNFRLQHISPTGTVLGVIPGIVFQNDIAVGPQGHVYVAQDNDIVQYKPNGDVVRLYDDYNYDFGGPLAIDVDAAANLWVADSYYDRVRCYSAGRRDLIASMQAAGSAAGEWATLADVVADNSWRVWTSDSALHRVQRYTVADTLAPNVFLGGMSGGQVARWHSPSTLTLDSNGGLTVYLFAHDQRYYTNYHSSLRSVSAAWDGGDPEVVWSAANENRTGLDFETYWYDRVKTYYFSGDGTHTVTSWGVDGAGNSGEPTTTTFGIDTTPPSVVASGLPEATPSGWVREPYSVSFSAEDTMSGISGYQLVVGSGYGAFGTTYDFDTDGRYSFSVLATDVAGNQFYQHYGTRNLDSTAPSVTVNTYDLEAGGKVVSADPSDGEGDGASGVATVSVTVDGARAGGYQAFLTEVGTYTVSVSATDNAGNSATWGPVQVVVAEGGGGGGGGGDVLDFQSFTVGGGRSWVNTTTLPVHSDCGGAETMQFSGNGITWTAEIPYSANATVTIPNAPADTDSWMIKVRYWNAAHDDYVEADAMIALDRVAPVTASTNVYDGEGGWPAEGAFLTFIQGDSLSNAWPMCSVDGSAPVDVTLGITVTGQGTHTIEWWSEDEAGNEELPHHTHVINVGEPEATALTVAYQPTSVTYPGVVTIAGTLTAGAEPLPGKTVALQKSSTATGPWVTVTSVSSTTGAYVAIDAPSAKCYYRLSFAGGGGYSASESSASGAVSVKPTLSTPSQKTTVYYKRTFSFYSLVRPRHSSGVTFKFYRYSSGKWRYYKSVKPRYGYYNSTTTKAYNTTSVPYRGKWYVVAVHSDTAHTAVTSSRRYFTVR